MSSSKAPRMRPNPVAVHLDGPQEDNRGRDGASSLAESGDEKSTKHGRKRRTFGTKLSTKLDRFRVDSALVKLATGRKRRDEPSHRSQELAGASISESGHLVGSRADKLAMFEIDNFDVDVFTRAHFSSLTEKAVATLRSDLAALDTECAEEVRGTVHDHYSSFIHACQGITELETSMQQLKDLLSMSSTLVGTMKEVASAPDQIGPAPKPSSQKTLSFDKEIDMAAKDNQKERSSNEPSALLHLEETMDALDVAIAERRMTSGISSFQAVVRAIPALSVATPARDTSQKVSPAAMGAAGHQRKGPPIHQLLAELEARRRIVASLLEQQIQEPTCSDEDLVSCTKLMAELVGEPAAAHNMLRAYSSTLKRQQMSLLKPYMSGTGGSTGDGADYAAAVSQKVFGTIARAQEYLEMVFGEAPHLASIFTFWAIQEVERCGQLLRRHSLAAHASAGGLLASAQCVASVLAYCCALEEQKGLSLTAPLLKSVWPSIESVIQKRLRRIADEVKQVVTEEINDNRLISTDDQGAFPNSATLLAQQVGSLVEDLNFEVLVGGAVAKTLRQGIANLFQLYTSTIVRSIRKRKKSLSDGTSSPGPEAIEALVRRIAFELLPGQFQQHTGRFGQLCNQAEFSRHVSDLTTAMKE